MKLQDLTPTTGAIFNIIRQHGEISRAQIIDALCRKGPHKMPEGTISSGLSRLEGFGFVARPDGAGTVAGWRLTPEGAALCEADHIPAEVVDPPLPGAEPTPPPVPKSNPEPDPEPETAGEMAVRLGALAETAVPPFADGPAQYAAAHALDGSLVDRHLAFVRQQLGGRRAIPAESARVYRELITCLPLSIVEALLPITRLVEARP